MDQFIDKKGQLPNSPESWWIHSTKMPDFPILEEDMNVEAAIVGGGITGITTAYLLAKEGIQVALFEANSLFNGTTGHTTAKITAQHALIYKELIQHFGEDKAKLYYQANQNAMNQMEEWIKTNEVDCNFQKEDAFVYTNADDYIETLKQEADAYERLGIQGEFRNEIPLPVPHKGAVVMKDQAHFHPLHYLSKMVELMQAQGVQMYENCVASQLEDGNPATIRFKNGKRVKAKYVISASHFPFHDGRGYFARLYPERSYVIAAKPAKPFVGGMYINVEQPTRSIRPVLIEGEEMLLFSGDGHKAGQGGEELKHYQALEKFAKENFGVQQVLYRWSTQDLVTPDKVPYIGRLSQGNNVYVATGFRKWGMTNSHVAANIIKDLITGKANPYEELYTPARFKADPSFKKVIKENVNVASQLVSGKLETPDKELKDIKEGEGAAISIKGRRAGAYKTEQGQLYIVDTTCTHMGCEVNWNGGDRSWDCPCHGSRFTYKGEVMEGPAETPLKTIDPDDIDYSTSNILFKD
ncbi:FAD-dependent oxidoreductase [Lederbergia sp. NSJ-179]|uniref:FAD-dependent oxidoreductase n=1 Tax=Lederbergia sp. NSJ-179 TaxID=2931402 RepID=UPI001FD3CA97|nr:FAD-dependent oxidoreductase [Lederbergia sp. NSJ-179]MCJ7841186.1 FAD-dependent oxidoreductase [Lederbergia sp. NSJ-179]